MSRKIRLPEMTEKRKGYHTERKPSRAEHLKDSLNTVKDKRPYRNVFQNMKPLNIGFYCRPGGQYQICH